MNKDLENKLKTLKIEDFIWILYIGIIILSLYSNTLERKYFVFNDLKSKKEYKNITTIIFIILLIVYIYFFKSSLNDLNNLKKDDSDKKKRLVILSFLASSLILLSGIIFLYISIVDDEMYVELAFN